MLQKFCSKKKFYDLFWAKRLPRILIVKVNALIHLNLFGPIKCISGFFHDTLRGTMVVYLGLPDLTILFKIHMPIVQILKNHSVSEHARYWLAIVPVSQPVQTHSCCRGSPKFLTSASLTGHNSLFSVHSTIHIPYCLGSLRQRILFPKRNLKFKKQISKKKNLWRKMFESQVYIICRDESFKIN
jgi:hypothetical protein